MSDGVSPESTKTGSASAPEWTAARMPAVTLLWHAESKRVGERALLADAGVGRAVELSRSAPLFGAPGSPVHRALGDVSVSRQPLLISSSAEGILLSFDKPGKVRVDGVPLVAPRLVRDAELEPGVVLELSPRVALVLHWVYADPRSSPELGLVGESAALQRVRKQIMSVACHDVPVLLLGESGTGKELVARALHEQSARRGGPFLGVSMAAIPPGTAAAALFGHKRGAFTGADTTAEGYFGMAHGGTLFLDEIGATPLDIQAALLRVLETGELQTVGDSRSRLVDVRVVAATDANLDAAVAKERFLLPLLHRLRGYELRLPSMRERREDIGRLLKHFFTHELGASGRPDIFARNESGGPWLSASLVAELALAPLPGNVRELKNIARRLLIDWAGYARVELTTLAHLLTPTAPLLPRAQPAIDLPFAKPPSAGEEPRSGPSEDELLAALERGGWRPSQAARLLGVSRTTLYALMKRWQLVTAAELDANEIRRHLIQHQGNLERAASALRVSSRGLVLRLRQLGDDSLSELVREP